MANTNSNQNITKSQRLSFHIQFLTNTLTVITDKHKSTFMLDVTGNDCVASVVGFIANLIMLIAFCDWSFELCSWYCNYYTCFSFYREYKNIPLLSWEENRRDVCPSWIFWVAVHKSHIVVSKQQLLLKLWFYQVTFWKEITVFVHGPETFYFPIFAFAYRSLTVRSLSVNRAFSVRSPFTHRLLTVHNSAFTVQRALAFTLHKEFIVRSPWVHLSFTNRSSFAHRSQSVQPFSFGTPTWKDRS